MSHQLYAKIKKSSKYYHQNNWARLEGKFPFRVSIYPDCCDYVVKGGPGGQYRLEDVNLFVCVKGKEIRIR